MAKRPSPREYWRNQPNKQQPTINDTDGYESLRVSGDFKGTEMATRMFLIVYSSVLQTEQLSIRIIFTEQFTLQGIFEVLNRNKAMRKMT